MNKAVETIKGKIQNIPEVMLILGSGLGSFADELENPVKIPYGEIPGFPVSTVKGHTGQLVFGTIAGREVVAMQGRIHYYEGVGIDAVTYPVKVMAELGVKFLLVTNAAGGVNPDFAPGDLMLITDHINYAGVNPLIGPNDDEKGPRFPDMSKAYDEDLRNVAVEAAKELNIPLKEGVYMWFSGPTFETPAEVRMAGIVGADAVGMSTVPEVIVARHRGMKVLGISCITNYAAGISENAITHAETIDVSARARTAFTALIRKVLENVR